MERRDPWQITGPEHILSQNPSLAETHGLHILWIIHKICNPWVSAGNESLLVGRDRSRRGPLSDVGFALNSWPTDSDAGHNATPA